MISLRLSLARLQAKREIIELINSKFYDGYYNLMNLQWKTKSVLASNRENHLNERFADLDFSIYKV